MKKGVRYKVICPLHNFKIRGGSFDKSGIPDKKAEATSQEQHRQLVEGIELQEGVRVRLISKEDMEDIPDGFITPMRIHPAYRRISHGTFTLEVHVTCKDVADMPDVKLGETLGNIVLAMRLLKRGYVSFSYIFFILTGKKRQLATWLLEPRALSRLAWGFRKYTLTFDEIPHLCETIKKVQRIDFKKRRSLHLACRRFQYAYEREDLEERLIDFMIAFETLFIRGERTRAQYGMIIAIACSTLLGKNEEEREKIRSFLSKAYSIRNKIVHGQEFSEPIIIRGKQYDLSLFVLIIEDHLRDSIKRLLD